jgi:hypothetical protein
MERQLGSAEVAVMVSALVLLSGAVLRFTQLLRDGGRAGNAGPGTRAFFLAAAWISSLGAITGWSLVLAERAFGLMLPVHPVSIAVAMSLTAPAIGQMNAILRARMPRDADRHAGAST